jgi:hypothetical protein
MVSMSDPVPSSVAITRPGKQYYIGSLGRAQRPIGESPDSWVDKYEADWI